MLCYAGHGVKEHVLSAGSLLADLNQDLVEDFLRRLTPQNSVTLLKSPVNKWKEREEEGRERNTSSIITVLCLATVVLS